VNAAPLTGIRVVDVTQDRGELCGRLLADLGAEVIRVEPPGGSPARTLAPLHDGVSLSFALRNAGKKSVVLDLAGEPADRERFDALLATSDVLISSAEKGGELDAYQVAAAHPHLVVTSITAYGLTGPWSGRLATDGVLTSTGCIAYKAGVPEKPPLFPPAQFADDGTSVTFAFATLAALWQRDEPGGAGAGQVLDCSVNEAIANMGDWSVPNRFITRAAGMDTPDVRAGAGVVWPSIPCADGYVRVVILSPRQWRAMRAWLGEPEYLQDPELDGLPGRLGISEAVINPLIAELFAERTMDDIAAEAQQRGIVCTPLAMPADVLANEHFKARKTLIELDLGTGSSGVVRGPIPSGFMEVDGERAGPRQGPPAVGEHTDAVFADLGEPRPAPTGDPEPRAPLAGLRIADFGIGGVGVEGGRMMAEYGADVLKIESRSYPDFMRVQTGGEMSPSFASSSRSKRGFGANAKHPEGNRVLKEVIARCDGLIENNSTGVMDQLGLGYGTLHEVNPGLVMVSSQLMGSRGPWADFRGYGPSTRAAGGIEMLWSYADQEEPAGGMSIFPDHLCGRICALGLMAGLIRRRSGGADGQGAHVEIAQVEATVGIVGDLFTKEALEPGSVKPTGNRRERGTPWGAFRCANTATSSEEWVAITCRDDADWAALVKVMGSPEWAADPALATAAGRAERADAVEAGVSDWTATQNRDEVAAELQRAGVPAGELLTALESIENEHYLARGFRVEIDQWGVVGEKLVLDGPGFYGSRMTFPTIGPAPHVGENTRDVCRDLLGMDGTDIERLIAEGALEVTPPAR
jgi:crotonobetainyl-CoA:carnitine CoA-transferase CaiB-like acyl-CoA transferase